jgi:excisionase family DNA binding protein
MEKPMTMKIERGVPVMFTPKQVAQILNVSRSQVYVLIKDGELESVTIRGCRRISENQLVAYIHKLEQ